MQKPVRMMFPREFAKKHGVAYTTVMLWIHSEQLPEAVKVEGPIPYYQIPENAKRPKTKKGRKTLAEKARLKKAQSK